MSCFADGIRDVSEFLSGIFTDEESTAKAKGPNPQRPEDPQQPPLKNPDDPLGTGKDDSLPCEKKLLNAYFAEKTTIRVRASGSEKNSSASYIVKRGDTLSKIASKYSGVSYTDIAKKNHIAAPKYAIAVGQRLFIPYQISTKEKIVYKKITKASLGAKVFLVVKTKGYKKGDTLFLELYEKNALLVDAQAPLPFLKEQTQQTKVMAHISIDPDDGSEQAVVAIALRPKIDKKEDDKARAGSLEAWKEKFKKGEKDKEEKKDYLWLKITSLVGKGEEKAFLRGNELEVKDGCIDIDKFIKEYNKQFPTKKITETVKNNLKVLFVGVEEFYTKYTQYKCDKRNLAYIFATARLETNYTFDSVSEADWTSDTYQKKYFEDMYDPILGKNLGRRALAKRIGNTTKGDGVKYHGRGYCQITGKSNYKKAGDFLGLDLINNPELAKTPTSNAIKIILYGMHKGLFTGKKLSDYINNTKTDYFNARRIINGTDRAKDIKGFAVKLEKCF